MRLKYCGILGVLAFQLASCTLQPTGLQPGSFSDQKPAFEMDPIFQPGMLALATVAKTQYQSTWKPEDTVLLGVKVAHEDENDVWFVRLSTLVPESTGNKSQRSKEFSVPFGMGSLKTGAKFAAPTAKLLVETFDQKGKLLRSSLRTVPNLRSSCTVMDVLYGKSRPGPRAAGSDESISRDGMASMLTMIQLMGGSRALLPIRESVRDQIVQRPSLLRVLLNGLRLNVETRIDRCELVQTPWSTDAALAPRQDATFPVVLAGQRLFDCRVIVGPPQAPYNLTGGTLFFEAVHPEKPANRLSVWVLAAQHGQDEPAKSPATIVAKN